MDTQTALREKRKYRRRHGAYFNVRRCAACEICIYDDAVDAGRQGGHYQAHINQAVGDVCVGCATDNQFIGRRQERRIEQGVREMSIRKKQAETGSIFLEMETNVAPPPNAGGKRASKYDPMVAAVTAAPLNGDGKRAWCRFLMPSKKLATNAASHLYHLNHKTGLRFELQRVPDPDNFDCVWLYVRQIDLDEEVMPNE